MSNQKEILTGKDLILKIGREVSSDFHLDGELLENYRDLFYYLTQNVQYSKFQESLDYKVFKKGLLLYGDVGCGKSMAFRFLKRWYYATESLIYDRLEIVPFRDLEKMYRTNGVKVWDEYGYANKSEIVFDEVVKDENTQQKHYGNSEDVFSELIQERHALFIEKGIKTHMTSNATPENIKALFHPRVSDRMKEAFNVHLWKGKSLRK